MEAEKQWNGVLKVLKEKKQSNIKTAQSKSLT